jgi:hypothetical protein
LAKLEINIEGVGGWAANLPTWRLSPDHILSKIFAGGRGLTGYHVWLHSFIIAQLHAIYLFQPFTISIELTLAGLLFCIWIVEDFLWFVLNPAYGLKKFNKENIPWHPKWIGPFPVDYYTLFPMGIFLFCLAQVLA